MFGSIPVGITFDTFPFEILTRPLEKEIQVLTFTWFNHLILEFLILLGVSLQGYILNLFLTWLKLIKPLHLNLMLPKLTKQCSCSQSG